MSENTIKRTNPKAPLTATEVDAALKRPPHGRYDRLVLREPGGLSLRIGWDGVGSWILERKFEGRIVRRLLGYTDEITMAQARRKRERTWSDILAGNDPLKLKRARMSEYEAERLKKLGYRDGPNSLAALLDKFGRMKAPPEWHRSRQVIEHHFKPYLTVDVARITKKDILAVIDKGVGAGSPIGVKRATRYLSRVLGWAVKRDELEENVVAKLDLNELCGKEKPRQRALDNDEIKAVWLAADASGLWGVFAKLILLTGLRREELARLRWADIQGGVILLTNTKSGTDHRLPISALAQNIIAMIPRTGDTLFELSSRPNYEHFVRKLHRLSGTTGWAFHDLRRTHRTLLPRVKTDDLVCELMLNHQLPGALRRTYNLHRYQDEMREAADKLAAHVLMLVETGNVVDLTERLSNGG